MALAMFIVGIIFIVLLGVIVGMLILDSQSRFDFGPVGFPLMLIELGLGLILSILALINYFILLTTGG